MKQKRRDFLKTVLATSAVMKAGISHAGESDDLNEVENNHFRRITTEEAFITQEIADGWDKALAAKSVDLGFAKMGETVFGDNPGARLFRAKLLDIGEGRLQNMDETGIALQVLSLTAPGVQIFTADIATALAEQANDQLSEAVHAHPKRFAGLAAVAPQDPRRAAQELDRGVSKLGLKGAIINSHTMGEYLDDQKFWPIFEAAASLDVPIYLHPQTPSDGMIKPFLDYGIYGAGWGFAAETGLHAIRLIMCGVFDEFPNLKIILGHMGEAIPFWIQRIDNRFSLMAEMGAMRKMPRLPSEYLKDHFVITTSGVHFHPVLKLVHEVMGADRIMFATDYPYESVEEAVVSMDTAPIPTADKQKIYNINAEQLFKLNA